MGRDESGVDRRRFFRHPAAVPLECRKVGHEAVAASALRDFGFGGVSFVGEAVFAAGDRVEIGFPSLPSQPTLGGQVVWTAPIPGGSTPRYANGVRFLDEDSFLRARLVEQMALMEANRLQQPRLGRNLEPAEAARKWAERRDAGLPGPAST